MARLPAEPLSTQLLEDFLALASSFRDEEGAILGGVEFAAETLSAEVAALVAEEEVVASVDFSDGRVPVEELVAIARESDEEVELADLGPCETMFAPLDEDGSRELFVAHLGPEGFTPDEHDLLRVVARVLSLRLESLSLIKDAAHRAFHDSLTGLANRVLFIDRLRHAGARAMRSGNGTAVLVVDLDGFRTVNENFGLTVGDQLLVAVAQRLDASVRVADTVARFGGDQFGILLDEIGEPADAVLAAQRALEALEPPITIPDHELLVSASIGIAVGVDSPEELLTNADLAMHEAKGGGGSRYELFRRELHLGMTDRLEPDQDRRPRELRAQ